LAPYLLILIHDPYLRHRSVVVLRPCGHALNVYAVILGRDGVLLLLHRAASRCWLQNDV